MTKCKDCGGEVPSGADRCPNCGSKDYVDRSDGETRREARSSGKLFWTVAAGILIGAAIGSMFWVPFGSIVLGAAGGVAGYIFGTIIQSKET